MWKQVDSALAVAAADASSGFLAWAAQGRMPGQDGTVDEAADPMVRTVARPAAGQGYSSHVVVVRTAA